MRQIIEVNKDFPMKMVGMHFLFIFLGEGKVGEEKSTSKSKLLTQCDKDASRQLKSKKHQNPPHPSQNPRQGCVSGLFSVKNILQ